MKAGKSEKAIFKLYSLGVVTNRDEWVYDFEKTQVGKKVKFLIDKYNQEVDRLKGTKREDVKDKIDYEIKWTRAVKNDLAKGKKYKFDENNIIESLYRPFVKKPLYFAKELNEMQYQMPKIFGLKNCYRNKVICFSISSRIQQYSVMASSSIPSLALYVEPTQTVPLYHYNSEGQKIDNITDWALDLFRNHYQQLSESSKLSESYQIQKSDIFHYVYGVLHNPAYRKKYEQNLKRDFPRIPLYQDFGFWAEKGKALMDLHLNYDSPSPLASKGGTEKTKGGETPLIRIDKAPSSKGKKSKVPPLGARGLKPKLKADKEQGIIYLDQMTSLEGVPSLAWEYKLGNRSALEWVLDQYKEKKPRDKTIAEKFNTYRFADYKEEVIDLLQKACTVSVRTMEIIKEMEKQ